jgi:hypothetical protein
MFGVLASAFFTGALLVIPYAVRLVVWLYHLVSN